VRSSHFNSQITTRLHTGGLGYASSSRKNGVVRGFGGGKAKNQTTATNWGSPSLPRSSSSRYRRCSSAVIHNNIKVHMWQPFSEDSCSCRILWKSIVASLAVRCLATRLRNERHIWQQSLTELGIQVCRWAAASDCVV
jgi:hypothetical protein